MRLLLDTHALVWWWDDDSSNLSARASFLIADPANDVAVSAATAWEIAIKATAGKLASMERRLPIFVESLLNDGFTILDIGIQDAIDAGRLVGDHADPFDRLLVAQAVRDDRVLVSRDRKLAQFDCEIVW